MAKKPDEATPEAFTPIGSLSVMPLAKGLQVKKQTTRSRYASPPKAAVHLSKSDQILALLKRTSGTC